MNRFRVPSAFLSLPSLPLPHRPRPFRSAMCTLNPAASTPTTPPTTPTSETSQAPIPPPRAAPKRAKRPQPRPAAPPRGDTLLLIGLGNPGSRYNGTRHNIGFDILNAYARSYNASFKLDKRFRAEMATLRIDHRTLYLAKPTTFMNNSGTAVAAIKKYYKLSNADILVLVDDMSLNVGRIRLREKGSAGGHNGLKSIQTSLSTNVYARLKVGVGSPNGGAGQWKDFVLNKFNRAEKQVVEDVSIDVMNVLDRWAKDDDMATLNNQIATVNNRQ